VRKKSFAAMCVAFALATASMGFGQVTAAGVNYQKIALLKWSTDQAASFVSGTNPFGVAFDGANVWVTNLNGNNVTKFRAADGAVVGSFSVGAFPAGVAFDGAAIWVANYHGNSVTKLRAADGVTLGTFPVGIFPW
jgi:DNA-binding beta-propeller fold protein YncE